MNPFERAGRSLLVSGRPAAARARRVLDLTAGATSRLGAVLAQEWARAGAAVGRVRARFPLAGTGPGPVPGAGRPAPGTAVLRSARAGHRRMPGAAALAAGLTLTGFGVAAVADRAAVPAATPSVADVGDLPTTVHGPAPAGPGTTALESSRAPAAPPVRLRIPRIGVDTALSDLMVQDDGHLAAPAAPDTAGWWSQGPVPGSPGTAVIVGHLDSRTGPAVFAGLGALRPGDEIDVRAVDGTSTTFTVQALRSYEKQDFPAEQVFGDTAEPSLRLITCGGDYDRTAHAYRANLVVFAAPAPTPTRAG